jgi:hypothetical protein
MNALIIRDFEDGFLDFVVDIGAQDKILSAKSNHEGTEYAFFDLSEAQERALSEYFNQDLAQYFEQ